MRTRLRHLFVAIALGAGIAACSDGSGASPTMEPPAAAVSSESIEPGSVGSGACELLTVDDVLSAGLIVVTGPATDETAPGDECVFVLSTTPGSVVPGRLTVFLYDAESAGSVTSGQFTDAVAVPGIGLEAWTSALQGSGVSRLADGRVVWVQLAAVGPDDQTARLTTLLAAAVARAGT